MDPWNQLTGVFHDEQVPGRIPAGAADNILLAYPPILEFIDNNAPVTGEPEALDIGCGAGQFCRALHDRGYHVTGVDPSDGMIEIAREHLPSDIALLHGDITTTPAKPVYDIITAIMVFHYVEDIDQLGEQIDARLKPDGLLAFAVFNPLFVMNLLKAGLIFNDFDSPEQPVEGHMELIPGVRIPVFIRRPADYQDLFASKGYTKLLEARPPFTNTFLKKYPVPFPTHDPEYLILGFRKGAAA
jgi:SAM-dependent methyltransferase